MLALLWNVTRLCLVPLFVWAGFIVYGLSLKYLEVALPASEMDVLLLIARMAQGFLAAVVLAILFCYPLAYVYRRFAIGVAALMALPGLILHVPDIMDTGRSLYAMLGSGYQLVAYVILLIAGARVARSQLERNGWIKWDS